MSKGNGASRKRVKLKLVPKPPPGSSVFALQGGPFVVESPGDTDYLCGKCESVVIAKLSSKIHFQGETGPVIVTCWKCGANNLGP